MGFNNSFGTHTPARPLAERRSRSSACRRSRRPVSRGWRGFRISLKILLENLLRREDARFVDPEDIQALAGWDVTSKVQKEIAFTPARVLLQDFTGVPGRRRSGGDARRHRAARRRPEAGQSAAAGRARHRSFGAGRSLSRANAAELNAAPRVHTATASATRSCAGVRTRSRTSASFRPTPASCTR